jgi:hypothetical protein
MGSRYKGDILDIEAKKVRGITTTKTLDPESIRILPIN